MAEARGIKHLGENLNGTKQISSHFACPACTVRQESVNVKNITGYSKDNNNKVTRPLKASENLPPVIQKKGNK